MCSCCIATSSEFKHSFWEEGRSSRESGGKQDITCLENGSLEDGESHLLLYKRRKQQLGENSDQASSKEKILQHLKLPENCAESSRFKS